MHAARGECWLSCSITLLAPLRTGSFYFIFLILCVGVLPAFLRKRSHHFGQAGSWDLTVSPFSAGVTGTCGHTRVFHESWGSELQSSWLPSNYSLHLAIALVIIKSSDIYHNICESSISYVLSLERSLFESLENVQFYSLLTMNNLTGNNNFLPQM